MFLPDFNISLTFSYQFENKFIVIYKKIFLHGGFYMNRLIKILRSRFFLGVLLILLEFALLLAVFVLLYEFFLPFAIVCWVFHIGILLYLINHDDVSEFKLPWMLILCLLPVIGPYVYMLFSSNSTSKKEYERYENSSREMIFHTVQTPTIKKLKDENLDAWLQANYLYNAVGMPCFDGSKTTYYALGEDFHLALLEELQKAESFIFMEYFIIQEGKMWDPIHEILKEKAALGVNVYVIYDDFGCMTTIHEHYYRRLTEEGIHCIPGNKFKPVLSHIHNNRDHRKITVIDGKTGFTGGINLADEYINTYPKHGHWKDTAIKIEGGAVKNLMALFITSWNAQSNEHLNCARFMGLPVGHTDGSGYMIPFGDGPEPVYTDNVGKNVYLNMIAAAKDYLYITTPYLICDRELLNALRNAAKKGVDIRLITPHIPDKRTVHLMTRSNYEVLLKDGVKIYEYTPGFIHAKSFVCDDKFAVCGTINLDYRSLVHHFECAAWMYNTDCIGDMKADFLATQDVSQRITNDKTILSFPGRLFAEIMKIFSPLF